jgi:hypothetical protein
VTGRRVRYSLAGRQALLDDDTGTEQVYSPSRHDPVVRAASTVVGGPAGRLLASTTRFWRAVPILVMLACAVLSLGLVQKQHCRANGWTSPDQFWHACYSDIPVLYGSVKLGENPHPGLSQVLGANGLGQPPLAGTLMWLTSSFVPDHGVAASREYFDLSVVVLALLLAIAVAAVGFTSGRRSWDAAHLALSPVLITAGLISYELLAVTLVAASLLALARARPVLGGVLLGLAVSSAPMVAVVGIAVVILVGRYLRSTGGLAFGIGALVTWFAVRVLLLPGFTGDLSNAFSTWRQATPGYGSIWLIPQLLGASQPQPADSLGGRALQGLFGWLFDAGSLSGGVASVLAVILLVALAGFVFKLTVLADPPSSSIASKSLDENEIQPTQPATQKPLTGAFVTQRVAPLALALLSVLLITAKSLPVQASVLLLPLIALSGLRWRDHLIWAGTEAVYFVGIWLYIGGETTPNRGLPAIFYLIMIVARLAGIAWVGAQGVLIFRSAAIPPWSAETDDGYPGDGTPADGQISPGVAGPGRLLDDRGISSLHLES